MEPVHDERSIHSFIHFSFFTSFVLSYLVFLLMATPEEEISALKEEIVKITARRDEAITQRNEAKEERLDNLITERGKTLNLLLQQQQPQGG